MDTFTTQSPSAARSQRLTTAPLTVGILGGGQLGRMLALAGARLGLRTRFFDPQGTGPCVGLGERFVGKWDDQSLMREFLTGCDVVTLENEWVDLASVVELLPEHVPLRPAKRTLDWISNKLVQKRHARRHGIRVGPFRECRSLEQVLAAGHDFSYPIVLKGLEHGYDGYGTASAFDESEARAAYQRLAQNGTVLVEAYVPFVRELSVVVVRRADGVDDVYPVAFTRQKDHRCEAVELPAPCSRDVALRAKRLGRDAAAAFDCVGVAAVEIFELPSGELLLNELAPRPHNSGHFTIDACVTSQFENHLRAILGWPLGDTSLLRPAVAMVNILGQREGKADARSLGSALDVRDAFVHLYGKQHVRPQRKMGHITVVGDDLHDVRARAEQAAAKVRL